MHGESVRYGDPSENVISRKYASWIQSTSLLFHPRFDTKFTGLGVDAAAHTAEHGHRTATQAISCSTVEEDLPVIRVGVDLGSKMTPALAEHAMQSNEKRSKAKAEQSIPWHPGTNIFRFRAIFALQGEATLSLATLVEIHAQRTCNCFKHLQRPLQPWYRSEEGQEGPEDNLHASARSTNQRKKVETVLDDFLELAMGS